MIEPMERDEAARRYAELEGLGRRRRRTRRVARVIGTAASVCALVAAAVWAGTALSGFDRGERPAVPVPIVHPSTDQVLSVGASNVCAITAARGVRCWGGNTGDGTEAERSRPVDVVGLGSGVASVTTGWGFSCALTDSGSVLCWGQNNAGQLGDGSTAKRAEPVAVRGLSNVVAVSAGGGHTCAITEVGAARCWGSNGYGQLGDGTTIQSSVPRDVVGLGSGVVDIATGFAHSCALLETGDVRCWGTNEAGELGIGDSTQRPHPEPRELAWDGGAFTSIDAQNGAAHTCGITSDAAAWCWGENGDGTLGDGTRRDRPSPVAVEGLPADPIAIAVSYLNTCAITIDGSPYCWGSGSDGVLGRDPIMDPDADSTLPVRVPPLPPRVVAISVGVLTVCVLTDDAELSCLGDNASGDLGAGLQRQDYVWKTARTVEGEWSIPTADESG